MGYLPTPQPLPGHPARLVSVSVAQEGFASLCKGLILWSRLKMLYSPNSVFILGS